MEYSIQFAPASKRLNASVVRRALAWARLLQEYVAAHPGREPASVTVLEVSVWKAARGL